MSFLRAVVGGGESRGRALGDGDDLVVTGGGLGTGLRASDSSALTIPAYYAGVSLIAETAGMVPLEVRRRSSTNVITTDRTSRVAEILSGSMNAEQSSGDVVEWLVASLLLRGRAYAWRVRTPDGRWAGYIPLNPARVHAFRYRGQRVYLVGQDQDAQDDLAGTTRDILHIRGLGTGGLEGWSPIEQMRALLSRSDGEARYQQSLLDKGVRPSGILRSPKELSPEAAEKLRKRWQAAFAGANNAGKTPVMEEGVEWQSISLSAADAQFLQQRQFSRQEIAMMLRLPAHMLLAGEGGGQHYSSAAMDLQFFAQMSVAPRLNRVERAIAHDIEIPWRYTGPTDGQLFPKFNLDALSEADPTNRFRNHQLSSWWKTQDEVRGDEGYGPLPGGDRLPPRETAKPPAATSTEPKE